MKNINNHIKIQNEFVFRTPLFPYNTTEINDLFSEAIYLTSPNLKKEYDKYKNGQLTDEKEIKKLKISYQKYFNRIRTRCTPFGLFAGLSTGEFKDKNEIVFDTDFKEKIARKTRPDMNILGNLAKKIAEKESIKPFLSFFPNTSLYQIDEFYRYVEYYYINNSRFHKISKVDYSIYLEKILLETQNGKKIEDLTKLIVELDHEISPEEAHEFILELITNQILVSEIEPSVFGEEFFDVLINKLDKIFVINPNDELQEILDKLKFVKEKLSTIDSKIINAEGDYQHLHQIFKELMGEISETNLFQTDLFFNSNTANLNEDIKSSINQLISFLNKITPHQPNQNLDNFKNRFFDRYEDQEISLLEALDTENGIGYLAKDSSGINDLIDDLPFNQSSSDNSIRWSRLAEINFQILLQSYKDGKKVIELDDKKYKDIDFSSQNLPHTFTVKFNVLDAETQKIAVDAVGGTSAASMLGRFGFGSQKVSQILDQIHQYESNLANKSILAEITHLPENRIGNILSRPAFREYEIPFLANNGVEKLIKITDLYISIKSGNILLRSKSLNQQIIPRMGNAHNFSYNALPIYQFLCDLQSQYFDKTGLYFSWGQLANQFKFLPRVEYKNIVIKAGTWQLKKDDFNSIVSEKNDAKKIELFQQFKTSNELPELFLLADGDNELLIDTQNELSILAFIDTIKNRYEIILEEFLYNFDNALVKDINGNPFTNECLAIVHFEGKETPNVMSSNFDNINTTRKFQPGSEWLYYKIYCGIKTSDFIITEKILPITEYFLENQKIDQWFFIRYHDTDNHIRFRLHLSNIEESGFVLNHIHQELYPLQESGLINKLQLDTYSRELERYDFENIHHSESLFFVDSTIICHALNLLDADSGSKYKWYFAMRATDAYLDDFGLTLEEKGSYAEKIAQNFFVENNCDAQFKKVLNEKYRSLRSEIESLMNEENDEEKEILPLLELIQQKSEWSKSIIEQISIKKEDEKFHNLLFSYVHMMHNRIFSSKQRQNEFIVYDLLSRHYKSVIARKKYAVVEQE